ncbi:MULTISPECIES: SCO1860 family LAETG-anchored protein [Streptacidiphilus]|uniref:SCO1860 family LAETG-anchored protein n=1 Tax=Streptacidiphilus cavernicola TaxID=3342716 RepID=A0ABV6ULH9_9ACTN|nr:SCO1860 family LAETG-anchored protein [Streptacidiphilus jeojiense]
MMTIRRTGSALGALLAVSLLAAAQPARADGSGGSGWGTASATTAGLSLDVRLINGAVDIPVDLTLNAVHAPKSVDGSMLTTTIGGVDQGRQLTLLDATLGHSAATVDRHGAHAEVDLVKANLSLPGLLTQLVGLKEVHATADCPVGGRPSADVNILGTLSVLGRGVSLSATGPTRVSVPGIGIVDLELSKKTVTSTTAAATALELNVHVNPLNLNVAEVTGTVELAAVHCTEGKGDGSSAPSSSASASGPASGSSAPSSSAASSGAALPPPPQASASSAGSAAAGSPAAATPAAATTNLAETGGGSQTPMIAGAALVLVGAGAAAVGTTRRRRRRQH